MAEFKPGTVAAKPQPEAFSSKFLIQFSAEGIGAFNVFKDASAPTIQGGYGGWEVVDRARQRGLTQWNGVEPKRLSVAILFDGVHNGDNKENEVAMLLDMATPAPHEPPIVHISGKGIPAVAKEWVIESITWGTNTWWGTDRNGHDSLLRQDAVVNLMQHIAGDRAAFSKAKPTRVGGKVWPKHYVVKKGDTCGKIAAKFYGNSKKWKLIANANNIRDPKQIKVGRTLTIPNPA